MDKLQNDNQIDKEKGGIKNKLATVALWALMLLPNANFANETTKDALSENFSANEITYNPGSNLDEKSALDYNSVASIPGRLKKFYKKLASINKKEDLKEMEFTQWEMWFLSSWQFMNPDWITKSLGVKASKSILHTFGGFTKEDTKKNYEHYKAKHPGEKISKKDFGVLSQPIKTIEFTIRVKVNNREYMVNTMSNEKRYLLNSPSSSLFMLKFKSQQKKAKIFESRYVYAANGKNKAEKTPIRLALGSDWNYFIQDINGVQLSGWCAIWVDWNLYTVDDDWFIVWKDGKRYPTQQNKETGEYTFDNSKFLFMWPYSVAWFNKDITTNADYLLLDVQSSAETMLADRYQSKKNIMMMRFQKSELNSQWYELIPQEKQRTLVLSRNWCVSWQSPDLLSSDFDVIDDWMLSARENIDKQLDQIESYKMQYKNKEKAFDEFVSQNCDTTEWLDVWYGLVYPISKWNVYFSGLSDFNGSYAIKKWDALNDGQSWYITIIDLKNGKELNDKYEPIYQITDWFWTKVDVSHLQRSILTKIKQYENTESYTSFLKAIVDTEKETKWSYAYYMNNGISYKWVYVFSSFGFETEREYQIKISKTNSAFGAGTNVIISAKMTTEEIKSAVDSAISKMK